VSVVAAKVVIYTTQYCGFCHAAKRLLDQRRIPYDEVAVDRRPDLRSWLRDVTKRHTVPQIFINGEPIGGYTDLAALAGRNALEPKLAEAPAVDNPSLRS
jgi:glutaredoxin 3